MNSEPFQPKALTFWTMPSNYFGASWPAYYVFLSRNRDSGALERANFDAGLKALGREDDEQTVLIVRENHWAVGWIEWIAVHQDNEKAVKLADDILCGLEDYPVVDEELHSQYELEEANNVWKNCYDVGCQGHRAD